MIASKTTQHFELLLISADQQDARLIQEAFQDSKNHHHLRVIQDGAQALEYLNQKGVYRNASPPDLVMLDLSIPTTKGLDLLAEIKAHPELKKIPVITSANSKEEALASYARHANCSIIKPIEPNQFIKTIHAIEEFWFSIAKLPFRERP